MPHHPAPNPWDFFPSKLDKGVHPHHTKTHPSGFSSAALGCSELAGTQHSIPLPAQLRGLLLPTWVHHGAPWPKPEAHLKSCSSPSFILPRLSCRRKGTSLRAEQEISCGSRL